MSSTEMGLDTISLQADRGGVVVKENDCTP